MRLERWMVWKCRVERWDEEMEGKKMGWRDGGWRKGRQRDKCREIDSVEMEGGEMEVDYKCCPLEGDLYKSLKSGF